MTAPVLSARMAAVLRAVGEGRVEVFLGTADAWGPHETVTPQWRALLRRGLVGKYGLKGVLTPAGRAWLDAHPVAGAGDGADSAQSGANAGEGE